MVTEVAASCADTKEEEEEEEEATYLAIAGAKSVVDRPLALT